MPVDFTELMLKIAEIFESNMDQASAWKALVADGLIREDNG